MYYILVNRHRRSLRAHRRAIFLTATDCKPSVATLIQALAHGRRARDNVRLDPFGPNAPLIAGRYGRILT
jgi:hypothetical protein